MGIQPCYLVGRLNPMYVLNCYELGVMWGAPSQSYNRNPDRDLHPGTLDPSALAYTELSYDLI